MNKQNIYTGQLNTRISIKERIYTIDDDGQKTHVDELFLQTWARSEDVSGNEDDEGKIIALNVRKYVVRFFPALADKKITDLFIDHKGKQYNVHAVNEKGYKDFLELKCSLRE